MPKRGEGLAGRCRAVWTKMGPQRIWTADELADAVGIQSYADKKMIWTVLRDARRRGEIERVDKGKYRARAGAGRRCGRDRMWSVIRMRRRITADDLAELAGVERSYASSYLRDLARTEVVRARWQGRQRVYELAHGYTGHMQTPPGDNAERIRRFRAKKKAAMEALDKAMGALQEARAALADD